MLICIQMSITNISKFVATVISKAGHNASHSVFSDSEIAPDRITHLLQDNSTRIKKAQPLEQMPTSDLFTGTEE